MDVRFDPDDERSYARVRDRLVDAFVDASGLGEQAWVVGSLLDLKQRSAEPGLEHWSPASLAEVLLEHFPRQMTIDPGDERVIAPVTARFLRFLGEVDVLDRDDADDLAHAVEAVADQVAAAMLDESRWGTAKRLFSGAVREGVDLTDRAQLDAYVQRFNAQPQSERDRVLGRLPGSSRTPLPPVVLAPREELVAAAEAAPLLRWVLGVADLLGDGRPLTDKGNLRLADGTALVAQLGTGDVVDERIGDRVFRTRSSSELPGVDLAFRLGTAAGFVEITGRRGRRGVVPDDSLERAAAVFGALLDDVGPVAHHVGDDAYGFGWYADAVDDRLRDWLLDAYRSGPLDLAELVRELWPELVEDYALHSVEPGKLHLHRELVGYGVVRAFRRFEQLGAVALVGVPDEGDVAGTVALTPLGTWLVQQDAQHWTSAPVVGALLAVDAGELLRRAVDLPEEAARAEVAHWREAHGSAPLVDALPDAPEAARGLVFSALLAAGDVDAAEPLAGHSELWAFRAVLRVDSAVEAVPVAGTPERWVQLLATVLELHGPHAVAVWAGPAAGGDLLGLLEQVWRVRHTRTVEVLEALGAAAPDKAVSKAARKGAYKARSAR